MHINEQQNCERVDCNKCAYFYITWDKNFAKGCKLFGFKSSRFPSVIVTEATGKQCTNFIKKLKR